MRTRGKFVLAIIGVATLSVALAEPADARRRIRFGSFGGFGGSSGYAEKIDKVYDLPDTGTYFHDGKYYDLGAFYQVRNGMGVYPKEPSFVLYNGDRYVKLGGAELTMLTVELGMDPTATYRASYSTKSLADVPRPKSANEIERLPGETTEQLRARVRKMARERGAGDAKAARSSGAAQVGVGWAGAFFLPMLLIGGIFVFGIRKFLRKRAAAAIASGGDVSDQVNAASFDQRVAARLRELEGGQSEVVAGPAMPAPRTFGRKLA
ncbi:hypothetical protein E5A73_06605 [Sphingomonas gei]|uniref:Uncharacterized protein n=1 Tax=Sphingomonas gei TaxID=1395960 RepID=A0A4S1XEU0_9SPHN|nr:hypothetical protein [Sphingomonas gei]TGX55094.1 hypothetical protein E5A73_06605 [Sphingomonas gei]